MVCPIPYGDNNQCCHYMPYFVHIYWHYLSNYLLLTFVQNISRKLSLSLTHTHTHTTILRPFFRDHPGEPVPEENFWTLRCKGRLTEADTSSQWSYYTRELRYEIFVFYKISEYNNSMGSGKKYVVQPQPEAMCPQTAVLTASCAV